MEVERFLEEEVDFLAFFAGGVGSSELEVARVFDLRRIRGISSSSDESSKGCFACACAFDCLVFTMMLLVTMARKRETKVRGQKIPSKNKSATRVKQKRKSMGIRFFYSND